MKRYDIIQQLEKKVAKTMPVSPNPGDCWELSALSIKKQVLSLDEGEHKVFYTMCKTKSKEEINVELVSETIFISPTDYKNI